MRKLLFILIILTAVSCKKGSDPAPFTDLTRDPVGRMSIGIQRFTSVI